MEELSRNNTIIGIKKDAKRHLVICLDILILMYLLPRLATMFVLTQYNAVTGAPLITALLFSIVESIVVTRIWKWVATRHASSLPTFYTACSGFRILLALILLLAVYLIVGRDQMLPYFLWILVFYFVLLVLHTLFFSREMRKIYEGNNQ